MKEFSFPYSSGLNKGMRPDKYIPRNSDYLFDAYNVKIGRVGCQPFVPLSTGITSPDPAGYRTPQLFAAKAGLYLGTRNGLYQIDSDLSVGTVIIDTTMEAIGIDTHWTLADFGQYQIWSNGLSLWFNNVVTSTTGGTVYAGTFAPDIAIGEHSAKALPYIRLVADLHGRLFVVADLLIYDPDDPPAITPFLLTSHRTKVMWSRAGVANSADLTNMISMLMGDESNFDPLDVVGYGNIAMPWQGTVAMLKALGDKMIVYGKQDYYATAIAADEYPRSRGGVTALAQSISPYPTFGAIPIHDIGVAAGRPVAGDKNRHIFVDMDGVVWSLSADLKKERLGYEEYLAPLMTTPNMFVYVSHDPVNDDYYITIGNNGYSFLLSRDGMSRVFQTTMSIAEATHFPAGGGAQTRSIQAITKTNGTDLTGFIVTDALDMGMRGIKTLTGLEIGSSGDVDLSAAVDYKYISKDAFTTGTYKVVSKSGTVTPMVSGTDFRVRVKASSYIDFDLDYINMRWKAVDKRLIRGIYEPSSSKTVS